ncbi:hypothetical protein [uncultured Croceitalea sp.]
MNHTIQCTTVACDYERERSWKQRLVKLVLGLKIEGAEYLSKTK